MGCWSSNQEEVKNPRGGAGQHVERARPARSNPRGGNPRGGAAASNDPYCGNIDKIENAIPETYVGEGIKRTQAFTIDLTEEKYEKWKNQFWETRCEGSDHIWKVLRNACQLDAKEAAKLLEDNKIMTDGNRMTYWYDMSGKGYAIPPACINEPVGYGVDHEKDMLKAKEEPSETETLQLTLRNASTFKDDEIEISNGWTVSELKEKYADLKDVDDASKIRILYYGKELLNEFNLYHYDIKEEIILIVVINFHLYDDE